MTDGQNEKDRGGMKMAWQKAALIVAGIAAALAGESIYFYRRTMKRTKAKKERTIKMAGTDWSQYAEFIGKRKEYFLAQAYRDVHITSHDGLKLHATYFPGADEKRIVICFHGYTVRE